MLTGTDLREQEAFDPEAIPFATPRNKNNDQEIAITTSAQSSKSFVPPTSFYANPPEKKEKRKPLWVPCRVYFLDSFTNPQRRRHDPDAQDAVVMIFPTKEHEAKFNPRLFPPRG